jgi:hypothetical protein
MNRPTYFRVGAATTAAVILALVLAISGCSNSGPNVPPSGGSPVRTAPVELPASPTSMGSGPVGAGPVAVPMSPASAGPVPVTSPVRVPANNGGPQGSEGDSLPPHERLSTMSGHKKPNGDLVPGVDSFVRKPSGATQSGTAPEQNTPPNGRHHKRNAK